MKKKIFIISLILFLGSVSLVFACEPCMEILGLEETINKAGYIVLGQTTGNEGPHTDPVNHIGGPEWFEIEINNVLKGEISENKIKLAGWYGMCGYGFINLGDDINYVLFVQKAEKGDVYEAVEWGCAVRKLVYKNGVMTHEGETMTLDKFSERFGLKKIETIPTRLATGDIGKTDDYEKTIKRFRDNGSKPPIILISTGGLAIFVILVFLFVKFLKKK